jgi:hypothetical protein
VAVAALGLALAPAAASAQDAPQQVTDSAAAAQVGAAEASPSAAASAPVTANAPITILSPGSEGDATGPGGETPTTPTPPGTDTPPQGSPPGTDTPPQGSPPGGDGPGSGAGAEPDGNTPGRDGDEPSRGRRGELESDPGSSTGTERRESGAPAGELPFTGALLWLVALLGAALLAIGTRERQLTAA